MKVLVVNCGSSSLKFAVVDAATGERGAEGSVASIGHAEARLVGDGSPPADEPLPGVDHAGAAQAALRWLRSIGALEGVEAIGHRVVHGGTLTEATAVDATSLAAIEEATDLAPLHNRPALAVLRVALDELSPLPSVAVFDTAYHAGMPPRAAHYAIPTDLARRHHIRRYGFHGLAHRYLAERYAEWRRRPLTELRLVTLQLGAGCSAAAVLHGRSVDTSMGFTPLEGMMMATRSGDIDPSLAGHLAREEGVAVEEVEGWLNTASGLLGVSGRSADVRDLLAAEAEGDERAALALDMFCYRARKQVGAYLAALGGADAVVFGGGIGERAPSVRARILADMEWCGLVLDEAANDAATGTETVISLAGSAVEAAVLPVDESLVIARDTAAVLA